MTGLNRAGFYRWRTPRLASPVEMEIRDEMQKIAVEWPAYGYRRITVELQHRGFSIHTKRVLRMMREDNLLCVRRHRFVVTTDRAEEFWSERKRLLAQAFNAYLTIVLPNRRVHANGVADAAIA